MVLESIVSSFLNRFLGDYFDNFSSDNLTVGLWNGEATVGQLNMTPRIGTSCFFAPYDIDYISARTFMVGYGPV